MRPQILVPLLVLALLAGCTETRKVQGDAAGQCGRCHGSAENPAPPTPLRGENATTSLGVGAHQRHLRGGTLRQPIECGECHVVPRTVDDPGHMDTTPPGAEVTFGALARSRGAEPRWDRDGATCTNVYCHGATLPGGVNRSPIWTRVDGSQATCGNCHGVPPPPPHPQNERCATCHPDTVDATGRIIVSGGFHVNGQVEADGTTCTACHGTAGRPANAPAPPTSTRGETETSARGVGAHQSHLNDSAIRAAVRCSECHVVPSSAGHADGKVDLAFGPLARSDGAKPSWNGTTCSNVYCHGATLGAGGTIHSPAWTHVDGTQAACGTCHGAPPPAPHPQNTRCAGCHRETVDDAGRVRVAGNAHINGSVEIDGGTCSACHGQADRPTNPAAPPLSTRGETDRSARGVGAHLQHLEAGAFSRALPCSSCHAVPTDPRHSNGAVDLTFGALATTGGAAPAWNGTSCANVYCHGAFRNGNAGNAPVWTATGQAACGSCHTLPPGGTHPRATACGSCHRGYTPDSVNLELHVNGEIDVSALSCTACHGDPSRAANAPAPPVGTRGETDRGTRAVGAHQPHLAAGRLRGPIACDECHVVNTSQAHSNGQVELAFGALARTGGAVPAFDGTSCSGVYCHGATLGAGGSSQRPVWTGGVDQAACGTCHGLPPPAPHPQTNACGGCHPGYSATSVALETHVNGRLDVSGGTCTSCHGDASRGGDTAPAPPVGTRGETDPASRAVGAHQAHLTAGRLRRAVACTECHVLPSGVPHSNGRVDLAFGPLARADGAAPSFDGASCASVYCHGATLGAGGSSQRPAWTGGAAQAACGTCHGVPPPAPHPQTTACGGCHAGYTSASVALDTHVNGRLDVTGGNCTSCHGDAQRGGDTAAAPPVGTRGETSPGQRAVGAHQPHLQGGSLRAAMPCTECHVLPTSIPHANGRVDLSFGPLARTEGAAPSFDGTTCANVYCHGATLQAGGSNARPSWTGGAGQAACGACHSIPPPAPHPQTTACGGCHAGYSSTSVDRAAHVNGRLDVSAMSCTSCHGDAGRGGPNAPAPPAGTRGETSTSARAVGAHQQHLGATLGRPVACGECHVVPGGAPHSNGRAEVTFGSLAAAGGASPSWSGTSCSGTWCHGARLPGGGATSPVWTRVDGSQKRCTSCHGIPTRDGGSGAHERHIDKEVACSSCHPGYASSTANASIHVNGRLDVSAAGWSPDTRSCANACHEGERHSWQER